MITSYILLALCAGTYRDERTIDEGYPSLSSPTVTILVITISMLDAFGGRPFTLVGQKRTIVQFPFMLRKNTSINISQLLDPL